ncbi:RNA polymerase II holoenzyme cyclin-like subunit [Coemansia interrupta]|uniref:RNA polymerase II holoenzyme cyclin-like subunit n=1 Tax=Coemansia interrupta TaxID=1126814 RepID=A0A9W8HQW1_9FUNG|nr:RNA polymerase II holoenzyme cyclin-like subunit [Coemansia interrupta]
MLRIGKRLRARQETIATAVIYFKRFYINNSFYDIDPYLMAATCMYLACKTEECPHHIKHIWGESKAAIAEVSADIKFQYEIPDIAECESYLLEEMKFYLVVYHPYQVLIDLNEHIKLPKPSLQAAWSIINDSYCTDVILVYPPHVIAVASLFLSRVIDQGILGDLDAQQWFADLNVDITDILQVVNDMIELYHTWKSYSEDKMPDLVQKFIADLAAAA